MPGVPRSCLLRCQIKDIEGAVQASSVLLKSTAFTWAASSLRGELEATHAMLLRMQSGEPVVSSAGLSEWATSVTAALQEFIKYERKRPGGQHGPAAGAASSAGDDVVMVDGTEILRGAAALKEQFSDMEKKGGASSLEELKNLSCWRHLLTEGQKRTLMAWRDACIKAVPKAKPAAHPKKSRPRKGAPTELDVDEAARAFFRMR